MAGRKYAVVVFAKTPANYQGMSEAEKAKPGKAFEATAKKYAGQGRHRAALLDRRRSRTRPRTSSSSKATTRWICTASRRTSTRRSRKIGGDPSRFGTTVHVTFGINPDADAPEARQAVGT